MLLLVIVPLCAVAVYLITGVRMPSGVIPTKLGWMSEEWLVDYRASHAS